MAKGSSPKKGSPAKGSPTKGSPTKGGSKKGSKGSPTKGTEKLSKKEIGSKKNELSDEEVKDCPITHVIFNLNGVLLDTANYFERYVNKIITRYDQTCMPVILKEKIANKTLKKVAECIIKDLNLPMSPSEFLENYKSAEQDMFDNIEMNIGVSKVVEYFKLQNIPMAVVTDYTEIFYNSVILRHKLIFDNFSHCVCYGSDAEAGKPRPEPDIFELAAKGFKDNVPKSTYNILVFENTVNGVDAAILAKMKIVWVAEHRVDVSLHNFYNHLVVIDNLTCFQPELFRLPQFSNLCSF